MYSNMYRAIIYHVKIEESVCTLSLPEKSHEREHSKKSKRQEHM
jgi:hypothetical protein